MRKKTIVFLWSIGALSCTKNHISTEQLENINGYWEIKEVKAPDAQPKEYNTNTVVDYFELKGKQGFRQKVLPQIDGTFQTNTIQENIEIIDSVGKTYIKYHTEYAKWTEEIKELKKEEMILINENNIKYHYKKFQPIKVE